MPDLPERAPGRGGHPGEALRRLLHGRPDGLPDRLRHVRVRHPAVPVPGAGGHQEDRPRGGGGHRGPAEGNPGSRAGSWGRSSSAMWYWSPSCRGPASREVGRQHSVRWRGAGHLHPDPAHPPGRQHLDLPLLLVRVVEGQTAIDVVFA